MKAGSTVGAVVSHAMRFFDQPHSGFPGESTERNEKGSAAWESYRGIDIYFHMATSSQNRAMFERQDTLSIKGCCVR